MRTLSLGEVAQWGSGGTPKRGNPAYFGPGVPWLSIADLNDGVVHSAKESLTNEGIANSSAKVVPPGTLFVAMYGSIGKLGIAGTDMATSQAIAFAKPNDELVDRRYLFHYLLAQRPRLQSLGRGGTQMNIGQADLKAWPIPMPPLPEQRRIAAILDQADVIRTKRRQVLAHLDSLTQSIFHDMFGDPTTNVHGFPVVALADWIESGRPITYGILKPGPDIDNGVPYIRVADMKNGGVATHAIRRTTAEISQAYRRSVLRQGDLLMSIRGHVGRFAHIPESLDGANITQDSARLSIADSASSAYVRAAMETPGLQRWMARHTKGVAVRGLNIGDLRQVPIPQPPVGLRREFAEHAQRTSISSARVHTALAVDDELFASLQSRAFRGEL